MNLDGCKTAIIDALNREKLIDDEVSKRMQSIFEEALVFIEAIPYMSSDASSRIANYVKGICDEYANQTTRSAS